MANKVKIESKPGRDYLVYILRCADNTLYTGITNNLAKRLGVHNKGKVKYTRGRLPVVIAWHEFVGDKGAALSREYKIKQFTRERKLELIHEKEASKD